MYVHTTDFSRTTYMYEVKFVHKSLQNQGLCYELFSQFLMCSSSIDTFIGHSGKKILMTQ